MCVLMKKHFRNGVTMTFFWCDFLEIIQLLMTTIKFKETSGMTKTWDPLGDRSSLSRFKTLFYLIGKYFDCFVAINKEFIQ